MNSFSITLFLIAVISFSTAADKSHQLDFQSQNEKNGHVLNAAVETRNLHTVSGGRVTLESMQFPNHFLWPRQNVQLFSRETNRDSNNSRNWIIIPLSDEDGIVKIESVRFRGRCLTNPNGAGRIRIRVCSNVKQSKRKWKVVELGSDIVAFESVAFPGSYADNNDRTRATRNINIAKFKVTEI